MGLTSAMNTGSTGLMTNQLMLETIGNNIANVNTTAFKSNRADFESQFSITLRDAEAPSVSTGGLNPSQVGLGATVGAIQRSFVQGSFSPTGNPSDLAIDGQGFFVVTNADSEQFFTRDGAFTLNTEGQLVTKDGLLVQGFLANDAGAIDTAQAPESIVIPVGTLTQVQATTTATVEGNLNADADLATAPAIFSSAPLQTATGAAAAGTQLTSLVGDAGTALFATGDVIELRGVSKGGFDLPDQQFVVGTTGTTVQDLMTFMQGTLGINDDASLNETAGITLAADGSMVVTSNLGLANAVELDGSSLVNSTSGIAPFSFSETQQAVGEGVTTSFIVYDSLGSEVELRLRLAQVSQNDAGSTWRFYAESADDTDVSKIVGTGTISFDTNGRFVSAESSALEINRAETGASDPVSLAIDFSALTGLKSGSSSSELTLSDQDGKPFGTLADFAIDDAGVITGSFTNGLTQELGQVAVATFANVNGLELSVDNNFLVTENSGEANITVAKESNAGRIRSGGLELSNVDLAREFIGLINASTGYSASSRVITTADELLQELLLIAR